MYCLGFRVLEGFIEKCLNWMCYLGYILFVIFVLLVFGNSVFLGNFYGINYLGKVW